MSVKKFKSYSELMASADDIMSSKITNKDKLEVNLKMFIDLEAAIANVKKLQANLKLRQSAISDSAAKYARAHFEEREVKTGQFETCVDFGGDNVYILSRSKDKPALASGDNLTKEVLEGLPKAWTRSKLELNLTAMKSKGVSDDDLAEYGLVREDKLVWRVESVGDANANVAIEE